MTQKLAIGVIGVALERLRGAARPSSRPDLLKDTMRWITYPLVAAAVGAAAFSVPEWRSALVAAAVISPLATADAPVALEAPVSEGAAGSRSGGGVSG